MTHNLLTRESLEIINFFQNIENLSSLFKTFGLSLIQGFLFYPFLYYAI